MVSSETFEDRAKAVSMNESEKLSVLCNILPLSGAAKFYSGSVKEPNTVSVTLKFEYRSEVKLCDVSKLKSITSGLPTGVTHVVSGIEFGFEAFYVFQKKIEVGTSSKKTKNKLELIVSCLARSKETKAVDNKFCEGITCKVFNDSQAESASISFSVAIESIKLLSETAPKSIPKIVILLRVNMSDQQVDPALVAKVEQLVSDYQNVEEKLAEFRNLDLLEDVEGEVGLFEHLIQVVRGYLSEDLIGLVTEIRKSPKSWNELDALIDKYRNSSFSPDQFERCFSEIFPTATVIDRMLKTAKSKNIDFVADCDLTDLVSSLSEGEKLVAFAFNSSALSSKVLPKLKVNVFSQNNFQPSEAFANLPVDFKVTEKIFQIFLQYNESNLSLSTKYILISYESEEESPNPAEVFVYNSGCRCSIKLPCGLEAPVLTGNKGLDWVEVVIKPSKFGKEFISEYLLSYQENGQERQKTKVVFSTNANYNVVKVKNLSPGQTYAFKVQASSIAGCSLPSQWSKEVMTDVQIRLATKIRKASSKVEDTNSQVEMFMPNMKKVFAAQGLRKIEVGKPRYFVGEKTVLVVGATGTGKTTFLNSMANYIHEVEEHDEFRLKIVTQADEGKESFHSRTKQVSAYCFNETKLPYRLVVVDTPGFGDTDGLAADKRTTRLIKDLFENQGENGIDHLDAVCIVVKASDSRLTAQQRHNFDSVLQLFGKDIAPNLFIIATFCDASEPPVKACLQGAGIDFNKFFKFNNSAFFEGIKNKSEDEQAFQSFYWNVGLTSFKNFFSHLENATPVSMTLSAKVLQKRQQLETLVLDLHRRVKLGISHLEQLRQEAQIMESYEAKIKANESFTYTIRQQKIIQEDISGLGIHTTTCMTCNFTCHRNCTRADNKAKAKCFIMSKETGACRACPDNCHWTLHKNVPYICTIVEEEVTKTDEDLRNKYLKATDDKKSKEMMIENLGKMFAVQQQKNSRTITNIREIIEELQVAIISFCFCSNSHNLLFTVSTLGLIT
jgi:predicted GTPase